MYTFSIKLEIVAIIVAVLAVNEASVACTPSSEEGGIWQPTYAESQEQQCRVSENRTHGSQSDVPKSRERSFSHQPASKDSFIVGGRALIAGADVKLMRGRDVSATLPKGQEVRILQVQGPWLGTSIEMDGVKKSGWVLASKAAPMKQSPKPSFKV